MSTLKTEFNYPEHKHPHGVADTPENSERIWVCEECDCAFPDSEIRADATDGKWGHRCKALKGKVKNPVSCESHLEPYTPDINSV